MHKFSRISITFIKKFYTQKFNLIDKTINYKYITGTKIRYKNTSKLLHKLIGKYRALPNSTNKLKGVVFGIKRLKNNHRTHPMLPN